MSTSMNPDQPGRPPADETGGSGAVSARAFGRDRDSVLEREKEEYGGVKPGAAFFGWLTATGMAVLLTALVAAAGAAVGLANNTDVQQATDAVTDPSTASTVGVVSAIILAVIMFLAYFAGGYVAGRMARFDGAKQGVAVWVWAIVIAILVAVLGAIAGDQFNVLANLNAFPRIPVGEGDLTTIGIITALVLAIITLVGAVLGGKAGTHYHRKVDRAGLTS